MGRPLSEKSFANNLRIAVTADDRDGVQKLRKIAERLTESALAGEAWAIQMIADRLDGKPAQAIIGDSEADAINVETVVKVIGI
jgi:hypothetical protein